MQDLIVVKQLPQIEEHLKELSLEVEQKVENVETKHRDEIEIVRSIIRSLAIECNNNKTNKSKFK